MRNEKLKNQFRSFLSALLAAGIIASPAFAGSTYDNSYCDAFCNQIVNSSGQVLSLDGSVGWTQADDEACAEYEGSPLPSPTPSLSPVPLPSTSQQVFQCQWHAGQALQYCQAYEAPQQSQSDEMILMGLDVVAAGACWTDCFKQSVMGVNMNYICGGAATAASTVELIQSFQQQSSGISKDIDTALSGIGIVGGAATVVNAAMSHQSFLTSKGSSASGGNTQKIMACGTAALMTALAGIRAMNMSNSQNTQQNACNSLQALDASAPTVSASNSTTATATGATNTVVTAPAGSMAVANGVLSNGKMPSSLGCIQNGLGAGGCNLSQAAQNLPDAQLLNSGLGQAIAPQAAQTNPSALMNQVSSGSGNPGSAVGQALSGSAPSSDIAHAISTLAAKAATDSLSQPAKPQVSAGGGGGGGAPQASSGFSFGSPDLAPAAGAPEQTFQAPAAAPAPASGDIFHADFKGSIFDIVSQKMPALQNRVEKLQWSTPLNRALAGSGQ